MSATIPIEPLDFAWSRPHASWLDECPKCEDAYPYPHQEGDEADRHYERVHRLDAIDPFWDAPIHPSA